MKRRLYQKLILAWICFAVLSFVSVAGITSSLVEKHLIKNILFYYTQIFSRLFLKFFLILLPLNNILQKLTTI